MSDDFNKITSGPESTKDTQTAQVEGDLQQEKDERKSQNFIFSLVGILLLDAIIFRDMPWVGTLALLVIEFILILVLGKYWGIDDIYTIIQNAIDALNRINFAKSEQNAGTKNPPPEVNGPSAATESDITKTLPSPSDNSTNSI